MNTQNPNVQRPVRLLRRVDSLEYFAADGWTKNPDEALAFRDSLDCARACTQHGLIGVEIAIRLTSASSDLFCTPMV